MTEVARTLARPSLAPPLRRLWAFVSHHAVSVFALLALVYLFLPIAVMVVFSFNDPAGRFNFSWEGFTLDAWLHPFAEADLKEAILSSLEIAVIATSVATVLGTLIALAMIRYRFFGRGPINLLLLLPLTTPEIVLGASLLTLFIQLDTFFEPFGIQLGYRAIVIAHVMFCISYVVVTVKSRLRSFDWTLEEAAMDLGANELRTFLRITLPLILPAIIAAALISFALSLDDFIITYFVRGPTEQTFPVYVWTTNNRGLPVQVNVIGTMIMLSTLALIALTLLIQRRRT
jgi:spermidine/putrescine transport system permease protein